MKNIKKYVKSLKILYPIFILFAFAIILINAKNMWMALMSITVIIILASIIIYITVEYEEDNERITESLMNYRNAIQSDSVIVLEANLSKDILINGAWKDDKGNFVELRDIMGLETPCSYDKYIMEWKRLFVPNDPDDVFYKSTDRKMLLKYFDEKRNEIFFDYKANSISGRQHYLRRNIYMIKNKSGDVIAYTTVKDISEIGRVKEQEGTIIQAVSTDYENVDIVFISQEEDAKYGELFNHKRTPEFAEIMTKEWTESKNFFERVSKTYDNLETLGKYQCIERMSKQAIFESFNKGRVHVFNFRVLKGTTYYYYQERLIPIRNASGKIYAMLDGIRSTDEETRKEMEIMANLEEARNAAEEANKAKSTFLFNMSHDIRTPMNAILGFTRMAKKYINDSELVLTCMEKTELAGEQLLEIINDVLEMSRIEAGKFDINEETVSVSHALDGVNPLMETLAITKSIDYSSSVHDISHEYVWLDRVHYNRVLMNLINNAIKYTSEGGKVNVDVTMADEETGTVLITKVSDTGIGMSEEFCKHLFEEFTREQSSTVSKQQGTGLGLAITKRIVDSLKGSIDVTSRKGEGSVFAVTLPVKVAENIEIEERDLSDAKNSEQEENRCKLQGKRILLVEDNELNRMIATDILEEEELKVEEATDGCDAVEIIKEKGFDYYDFVLMDIQMPIMNGYEAAKRIREMQKEDESLTIIALSANAFEEDKKRAIEAGMDAHIAKPIRVEELINVLASLADRPR